MTTTKATPVTSAWLRGVGLVTSLGDSTAQTVTSVRAGIARGRETSIVDRGFRPLRMALLPDAALPAIVADAGPAPRTPRARRMLRLAIGALDEACAGTAALREAPAPLVLAAPEVIPNTRAAIDATFVAALAARTKAPIDVARSRIVEGGRAAGIAAFEVAFALLATHDHVVVGGVDTCLDLALLAQLGLENRLLVDGVADGFVPGEGAGFVLLGNDRARRTLPPKTPFVRVHAPAIADEPGHRYSAAPYRGDGLATAMERALAAVPGPITSVWSSQNGEHLGAKEWGVAALRHADRLAAITRFEHPADGYGDLGAASAPVLIGLAAHALSTGADRGPSLVYCSSDMAPRGAICSTLEH